MVGKRVWSNMTLKPDDLAPDFQLELVLDIPQILGKVLILKDLLEKGPALLVFAKGSCPTCQYCLPFVQRIYQNYLDSGVSLAVIAQESLGAAQAMIGGLSLHMPILLDEDPFSVSETYQIEFVPTFFYVGQAGRIQRVVESFARRELVEISEEIARIKGVDPLPFFTPDESVPAFRPG